jgi:hypothetical protein
VQRLPVGVERGISALIKNSGSAAALAQLGAMPSPALVRRCDIAHARPPEHCKALLRM